MTFATFLALGIALFVVAPYAAHRLRRQRAQQRPFAAARLVPPTPPKARSRARLEDRPLFALRAASVVALALLGASPLVRCSRLALSRSGTSVAIAIVLDDSMSMRVKDASGRTRFARARDGAREILAGLRDGDAAAIVLAGAPARVGLAATTDVSAARAALEGIGETDRATDLDGALAMAKTLVGDLPQIDRRVIVLSDLADAKADAPPVGEGLGLPVWVAMPELRGEASDCGILSADRAAGRARVRFACSSLPAASGREIQVKDGDRVLATTALPQTQLGEASIAVVGDEGKETLVAVLTGHDAIASDDVAPVVVEAGPSAIAVVGDRADDTSRSGGAPLVEQALSALHVEMAVRPVPQAPDRREDTVAFAAMILDDPPGFTPEQRHALAAFVERGGMLLVALGRRAASAPLGASFEPLLAHAVGWSASAAPGVDVASGATFFGESLQSLVDLSPKGRARLAEQDGSAYEAMLTWADGAPFVARRARGRGEAWLVTLPFSIDSSDLALRPGFLALLEAFVAESRQRAAPRRGDVGVPWVLPGARQVEVEGPSGPVAVTRDDGVPRLVPQLAGAYQITADGLKELRVAAPVAREIDLRSRAVAPVAAASNLGGGTAIVDISWIAALALLALVAAEMIVRAATQRRADGEAA